MRPAEDFVRRLSELKTPYDGIDCDDDEAMERVEDRLTGDDERDAAVTLWELIEEARELTRAAA